MKYTTHPNAVQLKSKNKRFAIFKIEEEGKIIHKIEVKSLTKESGEGIGAISFISKNGKIKYSGIGFKEEALIELFYTLRQYLNNVL
jgi:hypothetical protein